MHYFTGHIFTSVPSAQTTDKQNADTPDTTVAVIQPPVAPKKLFNMTVTRQPAMEMVNEYQIQTISSTVASPPRNRGHNRSKSMGAHSIELKEPYDRQISSPTESYYSSVQELNDLNAGGVVNPAYTGSMGSLGPSNPAIRQVYREQYWTWSCQLRTWTRREKVLASVILFLVLVSFSLGAVIGILYQKMQDGSFSFSQQLPLQPWLKSASVVEVTESNNEVF